jgi:hypothetical protein
MPGAEAEAQKKWAFQREKNVRKQELIFMVLTSRYIEMDVSLSVQATDCLENK